MVLPVIEASIETAILLTQNERYQKIIRVTPNYSHGLSKRQVMGRIGRFAL
ncbi:ABC transporter substrate-binding protein [Agrobacterium tumefaciens]|nr:ABC transporter substrate-binding protein [Agrobacterium tumefaciens]